jgi:hypothetical protein
VLVVQETCPFHDGLVPPYSRTETYMARRLKLAGHTGPSLKAGSFYVYPRHGSPHKRSTTLGRCLQLPLLLFLGNTAVLALLQSARDGLTNSLSRLD